jgi:hypothetical protein
MGKENRLEDSNNLKFFFKFQKNYKNKLKRFFSNFFVRPFAGNKSFHFELKSLIELELNLAYLHHGYIGGLNWEQLL